MLQENKKKHIERRWKISTKFHACTLILTLYLSHKHTHTRTQYPTDTTHSGIIVCINSTFIGTFNTKLVEKFIEDLKYLTDRILPHQ